jgi:ABC-type transporter Mla MlaB component
VILASDLSCLAIGGDVDEVTYPALVEMLAEFVQGHREAHVDLSAVEYCDLAGLRAIVRLATTRRTVVLHGLPRQLQTVLGILGWDSTPGLVIDNKPSGLGLPPADPDPSGLAAADSATLRLGPRAFAGRA